MITQCRVCWAASTNASFQGAGEWRSVEDDYGLSMTPSEIEEDLSRQHGALPEGLEIAIEASGFEWRVETR